MKNIFLAIMLLITMSGCQLIKDIETITDHIDDTTNPNSQTYNGFGQYKKSISKTENIIKNSNLRKKHKFAVDITFDALKLQGMANNSDEQNERIQKKADEYLLKALTNTKEYKISAKKHNFNKEIVRADKVLMALNLAKEYKRLGNNEDAERKIKYACLLLVNDKNALWLWQNDDNLVFPKYLKWDDTRIKSGIKVVKNPDSLVFSGGGVKGTAYVGIQKYLEETGKLKDVKRFVGTSAGAIMCTFMSVGTYYKNNKKPKAKEFYDIVYDLMMDQDFIDFIDNPMLKETILEDSLAPFTNNIIPSTASVAKKLDNQYALCNGNKLSDFLRKAFKKFNIDENITLNELYKLTGKHLVLVTCSLSYRKSAYFDYESAPDLKVVDAVRASMAIPFIFKPVKYNNDFFIDGGAANNYPINYFDESINTIIKPVTMGFILYTKKEILRPKWQMIKNPVDYAKSVSDLLMVNTGSALFKKNVDRTVFINCGKIDVMSFDITKEAKKKLVQAGYDSVKKYFEPDYKIKTEEVNSDLSLKEEKKNATDKSKSENKINQNTLSWYVFYPEILFVTPQLSNVYGLCLGIPTSDVENIYGGNISLLSNTVHNVYGIQLSTLYNNSKNITGLGAAFINDTKSVLGTLLALCNNVNCESDSYALLLGGFNNINNKSNFNGLQLAFLNNINNESNSNSFQIGLVNNINLKFNLLDKANLNSAQIGVINNTNSETSSFIGIQAGLLNRAEKLNGFQIGFYNVAKSSSGIQIGILNKMDNAWIKYFPLINFSL